MELFSQHIWEDPKYVSWNNQAAITCSKLTIEILEQSVNYVQIYSSVFIATFEHISKLVLVFLLLTLRR